MKWNAMRQQLCPKTGETIWGNGCKDGRVRCSGCGEKHGASVPTGSGKEK